MGLSSNHISSYYKDKKILVTGGAGFIGSELCSQLSNSCKNLFIVDNLVNGKIENINHILSNKIIFENLDIRDTSAMSNIINDVDIVFHLACLGVRHSIHSPIENHEVNASATLELLKISKANKINKCDINHKIS